MVANGEPVGGHPVISEGEGSGEVSRTRFRRAVDAGLEGIALAATEPLRQIPVGAGAGEREAHHSVWREAIVEAGRAARCPCREIMATDHGETCCGTNAVLDRLLQSMRVRSSGSGQCSSEAS